MKDLANFINKHKIANYTLDSIHYLKNDIKMSVVRIHDIVASWSSQENICKVITQHFHGWFIDAIPRGHFYTTEYVLVNKKQARRLLKKIRKVTRCNNIPFDDSCAIPLNVKI